MVRLRTETAYKINGRSMESRIEVLNRYVSGWLGMITTGPLACRMSDWLLRVVYRLPSRAILRTTWQAVQRFDLSIGLDE